MYKLVHDLQTQLEKESSFPLVYMTDDYDKF